ncbi:hypothetical protein Scep_017859 [Stephania cephalantha]|uniref:Uncharacterized protein n=1 Tax=Stephania cephalantha TaxID=152367 RepID=A0AAP0IQB4_9MAGN
MGSCCCSGCGGEWWVSRDLEVDIAFVGAIHALLGQVRYRQCLIGKGHAHKVLLRKLVRKQKILMRQSILFCTSGDHSSINELNSDAFELEPVQDNDENILLENNLPIHFESGEGRSGFISFYGRTSKYKKEDEAIAASSNRHQSSFLWFIGPTILVASFILPSLYLRRILSAVFEDSLLTDFLILFFTEALFYCGVAVFLLLIHRLQRPLDPTSFPKVNTLRTTKLIYRISSIATLVLSLIIPMVTMGFVWPWTGPAASATLAPYLVGIVVQFAFEQYAKYLKSPSWPVIPIIFQIYRLHQLNRAAQLVTALSFTVRGAETTSHNLAISSSLGTLLNVLQFLGIICIWSLASFLMRFLPSAVATPSHDAS